MYLETSWSRDHDDSTECCKLTCHAFKKQQDRTRMALVKSAHLRPEMTNSKQ